MTTATERVCPMCLKSDQIQKVTSIVNSGTSTSEIYSNKSPFAQGREERSTKLVQRLQFSGKSASYGKGPVPPGCGIALAIFFILGGIVYSVEAPIIGVPIILFGLFIIFNRMRTQTSVNQKFDAQKQIYQEALTIDQQAMYRWQNELYYCFRDDCVFIAGQNRAVPPEQMSVILYEEGVTVPSTQAKSTSKVHISPVDAQAEPSGFIPLINARVTSILLFESGYNVIPKEYRVYGNSFAKATSRYIYWELLFEHPNPEHRVDFTLQGVYSRSDGSFLGNHLLTTHIEAGWTQSLHNSGWGWSDPNNWSQGEYKVDIYSENQKIASSTFTIHGY